MITKDMLNNCIERLAISYASNIPTIQFYTIITHLIKTGIIPEIKVRNLAILNDYENRKAQGWTMDFWAVDSEEKYNLSDEALKKIVKELRKNLLYIAA